jgi:hypothetical protein
MMRFEALDEFEHTCGCLRNAQVLPEPGIRQVAASKWYQAAAPQSHYASAANLLVSGMHSTRASSRDGGLSMCWDGSPRMQGPL